MKNIPLRPVLVALSFTVFNLGFTCAATASEAPRSASSIASSTTTPQSSQPLTLKAVLTRTLEHNPSLSLFEFRTQYLQAQKRQAQQRPALELTLEADNFAGTQNYQGVDSAELTVALSSVIERGNQRNARGELSNTYLSKSLLNKQLTALDVLAEVTRLYIDTLAAQERVSLAKQSLLYAKKSDATIRRRVNAGASPSADASRAQAATLQAQLTLQAEQQHLTTLKMALATQWGSYDANFSQLTGNLYQQPKLQTFTALFERVKTSPSVQIYTAQSRIQSAQLRLTKAQSATNLRWSVGIKQLQQPNSQNANALSAGISLPLFSAKRNGASVAMAQASHTQSVIHQEQALLDFYNQLYRAYSNREQALLTLKTLREQIIPLLKQAKQQTQQAYEKGRYSYLEYISANNELISAQRSQIEFAASALKYNTQIEQLTGQLLP